MEHFKAIVNDKAIKAGDKQYVITNDNHTLPLTIKNNLPHLNIKPYADEQWDSLPHVILISDADWDPSVLDSPGGANEDKWHNAQ